MAHFWSHHKLFMTHRFFMTHVKVFHDTSFSWQHFWIFSCQMFFMTHRLCFFHDTSFSWHIVFRFFMTSSFSWHPVVHGIQCFVASSFPWHQVFHVSSFAHAPKSTNCYSNDIGYLFSCSCVCFHVIPCLPLFYTQFTCGGMWCKQGCFWIDFWVRSLIPMSLDMELAFQHVWGCWFGCLQAVSKQAIKSLWTCVQWALLWRTPTPAFNKTKNAWFFSRQSPCTPVFPRAFLGVGKRDFFFESIEQK